MITMFLIWVLGGVLIYLAERRWGIWSGKSWGNAGISVLLIIVTIGAGIGIPFGIGAAVPREYAVERLHDLAPIADDGSYVSFTYRGSYPVYYFYEELPDGGYKHDYIYGWRVVVYQDAPAGQGYIDQEGWVPADPHQALHWVYRPHWQGRQYSIHIPEDGLTILCDTGGEH